MMNSDNNNIENRSITISLRMMWTIVVSMVIGSFSLAGIYFDIKSDIKDNKANQVAVDAVQNLTMENIKLDAKRQEINFEEMKRALEQKQDKSK